MIVIDASVIVYAHLPSVHSQTAESLLAREIEWTAPRLWLSEFRNVLLKYLRQKIVTREQGMSILENATRLMYGRESEVDSALVVNLALDSGCTAYDCEYVALARALNVPLVTTDRQILAAFPRIAVSLPDYVKG